MVRKLFLLDGMALVYRAHFALIRSPIFNSKGVNTSALYGFTQTVLDILGNQQPTHLAVAFDTEKPTKRHIEFPEYKAHREAMPEDIIQALPHVRQMLEALNIPLLTCDGYEADDIIGTLALCARKQGFQSFMVTPDKDFGQLVGENIFIYKPGRMGSDAEILGLPEIQKRWGIQRAEQVVDVLALMGDSSDNIPGVPAIGEKTAIKLVGQYGSVENLLAHTAELSGRIKETLEKNREEALLSKRLATLDLDAPCTVELESLKLQPPHEEKLKALLVEFEFNSIGRRLFGEDFKAGRGFQGRRAEPAAKAEAAAEPGEAVEEAEAKEAEAAAPAPIAANLKKLADAPHDYQVVATAAARSELVQALARQTGFALAALTQPAGSKEAQLAGLAFSTAAHSGCYLPLPGGKAETVLNEFRSVLESDGIEKVGHDLKPVLAALRRHGVRVGGKLFDTMIAHSLVEPEMRHNLEYVSEAFLGYTPIVSVDPGAAEATAELDLGGEAPAGKVAEQAIERADLAWQLRGQFEPMLKQKSQERVFYEIEAPLIPVLVEMEYEGITLDARALAEFGAQLGKEIDEHEKTICQIAGTTFNLNSPKQLGQILFETLKISPPPKKTRTGQYSTDEQTLLTLAPDHEIVRRLLEHRAATKLKSTYADALPLAISPRTGRVHTTYNQVMTATGRLNSQDPNLQNIPIRTERGQEIRKAFVPRGPGWLLLSADYSQIELRIIAALSREAGLLEAFRTGADVHTATAAKVFGVFAELVTPEMRRKAKMVNYGIAYGISAFGLAQRLGIPRKEAASIIDQYFAQFPGIRKYMDETIASCRERGYVETVTGRRRYLRDIRSANNTIRSAAERNAINAPIQGTAADMIKIAMINIHREILGRKLRSRMLLQVHDELLFDLFGAEEAELRRLVEDKMKTAIPLDVPMEVDVGVGRNWLEAH